MPIQAGTYKVRGKMENRSYYKPKYSANHLVRSINQQMSERVKTEPGFANTRANAAEFGVATGMSIELYRILSECRVNITNQTLRSKLGSNLFGFVRNDNANPSGQRTLQAYGWQDATLHFLNTNKRVAFDSNFSDNVKMTIYNGTTEINPFVRFNFHVVGATQNAALLMNKGIVRIDYDFYFVRVDAKVYSPALGKYLPTKRTLENVGHIEFAQNEFTNEKSCTSLIEYPSDIFFSANSITFALCVGHVFAKRGSSVVEDMSLQSYKVFPINIVQPGIASVDYLGNTFYSGNPGPELDHVTGPYLYVNFEGVDLYTGSITASFINGGTVSRTIISANLLSLIIPERVDGDILRVVSVSHNGKTYTFTLRNI